MGNTSQPMSMNIAPVPTVSLINKHRCRQHQGSVVSVDYYSHSINNSLESSYEHSTGSELTERGPQTSSSHSHRDDTRREARNQKVTRGVNDSENSPSTTPRTPKRSQDETLSVPAQKLRNFHKTSNEAEELRCVHGQDAQEPNSQPVQGSIIAWVNVDLIMHSYGKNMNSHKTEMLHMQSNQSAEATDSHCVEVAEDFNHNTGCFSVQVSRDFGTGQFSVEQNRSVEDSHGNSECYHELYPSESSETAAKTSHLDGESREFSMSSQYAIMDTYSGLDGAGRHSYNDKECQSVVYSFGPSTEVDTTASICLASVHAGDTSSFSAAEYQHENSYDSQMFKAFCEPGLCNTLAFNHDYMQDSMRSDVSMNSMSSQSTCESSPPVNDCRYLLNTSELTPKDGPSFGGELASCISKDDQTSSMGFLPFQMDRPQTSFGGGETMCSLPQEGLTSLGFRFGSAGCAHNGHVQGISGAPEALPERFDSFQSIPTSLMSSRLEALTCDTVQTRVSPQLTNIKPDSKHSDVGLFTEDEDVSICPGPCAPTTVPTRCPNRNHTSLTKNERELVSNGYMQRGSQGGSGKMAGLTSDEDDDSDDSLKIPSCSKPPFAQNPVDDEELADSNNNLQLVQTNRNSPEPLNFDEPPNDALSIFDGPSGYKQYYTAFLCCAPEDLHNFGLSFHALLEEWGFKIFLPPRDLVLTGCNFDNMSRALEERCNGKIIVILSLNYEKSEECSFLTSFARVLDPDARKRNIIPVQIDKTVPIKNVLKGLSIIRYNHDYKCGWLKQKLVDAIAA